MLACWLKMSAAAPRLSVAPMVQVTNREHRSLCRLLSSHATLYSEMVVDDVLLRGRPDTVARETDVGPLASPPAVLQLASKDPEKFARAATVAREAGWTEVNLNVGCPAKTAAKGCHGLALMRTPDVVHRVLRRGVEACDLPITVKIRLGVDELDSWDYLHEFVQGIHDVGVRRVVVHARKGLLGGVSTKDNRKIPPLKYDWVDRLVDEFPAIAFELNGGVSSLDEAEARLNANRKLGGVMLGRAVMDNPFILNDVDARFFGEPPSKSQSRTRMGLLLDYVQPMLADRKENPRLGLRSVMNDAIVALDPIVTLFSNTPFNRRFRGMLHTLRTDAKAHGSTAWAMQELISVVSQDREMRTFAELPVSEAPFGVPILRHTLGFLGGDGEDNVKVDEVERKEDSPHPSTVVVQ